MKPVDKPLPPLGQQRWESQDIGGHHRAELKHEVRAACLSWTM